MLMITRDVLRELAEFHSPDSCAVSFYFQPVRPQDKAHKGEAIMIKDLLRDALRAAERNGGAAARADLEKILAHTEQFQHGDHSHARAIFACSHQNLWREFELPELDRSRVVVNSRFHLVPIAAALHDLRRVGVVLADREKARVFDLFNGAASERFGIFSDVPRSVRTDGWAGYDAGHIERHIGNEAMHHFKLVADKVERFLIGGHYRYVVFGVRDDTWPALEPHLGVESRKRLIGRFNVDVALADAAVVLQAARPFVVAREQSERDGLLREITGEAQRNGRGAIGLKRVLQSLERGEVQALLLGRDFFAEAAECPHCGHLDTRMVERCAMCGQPTRPLDDVLPALISRVLRSGVELRYVQDEAFARAGNIGALLRFRADQNTPAKVAG
jgi:peptide subunit release factor 1 (eRF1)